MVMVLVRGRDAGWMPKCRSQRRGIFTSGFGPLSGLLMFFAICAGSSDVTMAEVYS